jgi:hypothetical protein
MSLWCGNREVGRPTVEEAESARVVTAVTGAGGWLPSAGIRDAAGTARAVAEGEAAGDGGGVERTTAGRGGLSGLGAAARWPPSATASAIATAAATGTPTKTAAPDLKLICSIRA